MKDKDEMNKTSNDKLQGLWAREAKIQGGANPRLGFGGRATMLWSKRPSERATAGMVDVHRIEKKKSRFWWQRNDAWL